MLFCLTLPGGYASRYEKNLQGDIVAVYNDADTKLVTYYYDAFGYCINNGSIINDLFVFDGKMKLYYYSRSAKGLDWDFYVRIRFD